MGNRRALLIVVAVVLAVVAFGGAFMLISGAEDKAKDDLAQVYVAKAPIAPGTKLTGEMFVVNRVENAPVGAILDLGEITGKVALVELSQNTPLVSSVVGSAEQQQTIGRDGSSLASDLRPGEEAITFSVDQVRGVAGFIQPGDTINMLVSVPNADGTEGGYQHLLTELYVLRTNPAVDATTVTTVPSVDGTPAPTTVPPSSGTITVRTDAAGAQLIANATQYQIYLSLNPTTTTVGSTTTTTAPSSGG